MTGRGVDNTAAASERRRTVLEEFNKFTGDGVVFDAWPVVLDAWPVVECYVGNDPSAVEIKKLRLLL